jgi:hypothetical protein
MSRGDRKPNRGRIRLAGAMVVAIASFALAGTAAAAELPQRTIGVTVMTHQRTDAKGRVTERLPSLRPWESTIGSRVRVVATFISWGDGVDPVAFARAAVARNTIPMITWESWKAASKATVQPDFTNEQVASGRWDDYIRRVARGIKPLAGWTYIRFDHEMNGNWYPWYRDPASYVAAWRHVVDLFRQEGVRNVRWVWAPNALSWTTDGWLDTVQPYWPGDSYVDDIGLTVQERYAKMTIYGQHLDLIHATWPTKPVVLPETNAMTATYMRELVSFVKARRWITNVTWFERRAFGTLLHKRPMAAQFGRIFSAAS